MLAVGLRSQRVLLDTRGIADLQLPGQDVDRLGRDPVHLEPGPKRAAGARGAHP